MQEVEKHACENVQIMVIANKCDTPQDKREVSQEDLKKFTEETGIKIWEASAKTGLNVDKAFHDVTAQLIEKAQKISNLNTLETQVKRREVQAERLGDISKVQMAKN